MLKIEFHSHTNLDPCDKDMVELSPKELINKAKEFGFDVLAITHHGQVFDAAEINNYAKKKGIFLIRGAEAFINKKHVLIYNISQEELKTVKTFNDLRELKKRRSDILVIAPHPYYISFPNVCLQGDLEKNIDVFDAVEFCHFYTKFFNIPNFFAKRIAKKYNLSLLGTSDCHKLCQLNSTFSLIDAKLSIKSIFAAIKSNKIKIVSKPLSFKLFLKIFFGVL